MKLLTQIFLASLILLKITLGSLFIHELELNPLSLEGNAIAADQQKPPAGTTEKDENVAKEEKIDLDFLIQKKAELKEEEEKVARKREELITIREDINKKIHVLTQLRNEIRAEMDRKKTIEAQKMKHLIKAYSAMKPQKAASLIEKLDISFAIELLSHMKGDAAGNILSFVDLSKAAKISEGLAKRP